MRGPPPVNIKSDVEREKNVVYLVLFEASLNEDGRSQTLLAASHADQSQCFSPPSNIVLNPLKIERAFHKIQRTRKDNHTIMSENVFVKFVFTPSSVSFCSLHFCFL